jgi:DNA-binding beta-propeller fold protein YncE
MYTSTNDGLASLGYISTSQLTSTLEGLGQLYISSAILSTVSFLSGYDIGFFATPFVGPGLLSNPTGVALDTLGNIYVADTNNNVIRRIDIAGVMTLYAGSSNVGSSNGPASTASFNGPTGVTVDSNGVYVADKGNNLIRFISGGNVTTFAGSGTVGSSNGPASNATFNSPSGIAVDSSGVYVADTGNNLIRQISGTTVTTFAGSGTVGSNDGPAAVATFNSPVGLAINSGIVYVADKLNSRVRQIFSGNVYTIASNFSPTAVAYSRTSNILYAADTSNIIRQVLPTPSIVTATNQGSRTLATFNSPSGLAVDSSGSIYVGESGNSSIRKLTLASPINLVSTVQGLGSIYITTQALITGVQNATVSLEPTPPTVTRVSSSVVFRFTTGIALDSAGNIYVSDSAANKIYKISNGIAQVLAGSGAPGFLNGQGAAATFYNPGGIAIDSLGNIYVGDSKNNSVRKISPAGFVTTLAGSGVAGFADGVGGSAKFNLTNGVAVDSAGNVYVADNLGNRIRKIDTSSNVTTLAGSGVSGYADGQGINAQFYYPTGVAVDSVGNVYVTDQGNNLIRKIDTSTNVTTFAGSTIGFANGQGTAAKFNNPYGVAVDLTGNVYIADEGNNRIRKIDTSSNVTTFASFSSTIYPLYLTLDAAGNLYSPTGTGINFMVPGPPPAGGFVVPSQMISTNRGLGNYYISTTGLQSTLDSFGPGAASNLTSSIIGLISNYTLQSNLTTTCQNLGQQYLSSTTLTVTALQTPSNYFVALSNQIVQYSNMLSNMVTSYYASNVNNISLLSPIVRFAGTGVSGFANGPAASAQFNFIGGVAVDSAGIVYVADTINHRIRKIDTSSNVTTLAGSGVIGCNNGPGTSAQFYNPAGIAVDSAGIVYVADRGNYRIRKIDRNSNVTTLAGSTQGFLNAQGTAAQFDFVGELAVNSAGIVYVLDTNIHRIRKIDTSSNVTTFAGSGVQGCNNGTGTSAQFSYPQGLAVDSAGIVYIGDTTNHRIRKIDTSSNVTTLAGTGIIGYNNGPGTSAQFYSPYAVAVDSAGNVYVNDFGNSLIRIIDRASNVTTLANTATAGSTVSDITADTKGSIYLSLDNFTIGVILGTEGALLNASATVTASLPAYPSATSSNVTTNIQGNTVAIYSGGYISTSKYLAFNATSLAFSNLYSFCNVTANAFYASNANGTNGAFYADGTLLTTTSDRRLKQDIVLMSNAIEKIQALTGVYYTRNDDPSHQRRVGFIAQDVEAFFPDLVFTDNSQMKYKSIKYESINVALLEAIKELDSQCDELISSLRKK